MDTLFVTTFLKKSKMGPTPPGFWGEKSSTPLHLDFEERNPLLPLTGILRREILYSPSPGFWWKKSYTSKCFEKKVEWSQSPVAFQRDIKSVISNHFLTVKNASFPITFEREWKMNFKLFFQLRTNSWKRCVCLVLTWVLCHLFGVVVSMLLNVNYCWLFQSVPFYTHYLFSIIIIIGLSGS